MGDSGSESEHTSYKKKMRNPDDYKRNKIKKFKLTGVAYENHRGQKVDAKSIGDPCR